ncbi:MAG: hypothetical protein Q6366_016510 [Candidatus Freyarchaeota archaeon]|nr:hypothetical protein [Candidatus Jordarchaeia archaeon]MBS7270407.1 hypothetical protein [Candidatus Jordarchaeia archaeon]MBS7281198.1 hypothetical protein [Candidatus Jordarchaeia archaeon]
MSTIQLEIINAGAADGRAYMNKSDMQTIGADDFDVIVFINKYEDWGAAQVISSNDCSPGYIMVDGSVLDSANVSEGDTVTVKRKEAVGGVTNVQIGVEPMAGQATEEVVVWVADHVDDLARLLMKRPIYKNLEIDWRDAECGHIKLRIQKTQPELYSEDVAIIDPTGREVTFEIVPAVDMTFNAILMIDVSGSMQKQDMRVINADGAVEGLRRGLKETPQLKDFIITMEEGAMVSRIKSAALATLLYLSLKIGRGWGENVQVITFADTAEPLRVTDADGNVSTVIKCTGESKDIGLETIANYIIEKCKEGSGLTYISGALKLASELAQGFPPNPKTGVPSPVMMVLLSDGMPNKGDPDQGIPVNPIPAIKKFLSGQSNWVLYCVGLGEADIQLMQKMAELGRGEFLKATDFGQLWKWYDTLAQRFAIAVKTTPSTFVAEEPS